MNLTDNDDYWNESQISKFNFEQDDNKYGDMLLLEDVIDNSDGSKNEFARFSNTAFGLNQSIEIETVKNYISEKFISCILKSECDKNEMSVSGKLPLDEQVRLLRRQIKERWLPPSVEDTINRILLGQDYSLELFRSLSSKRHLLKFAVECADGDAILAVVVYLTKTLKKSLFYQLMNDQPVAVSHYSHYLYVRRQISELNDLLETVGKSTDAIMKQLSVATQNPYRIQQRLSLLLKNYTFEPWHRLMIENYLKLVEYQTVVSKKTHDQNIIGESAVETLKYSYLHKLTVEFPDDSKSDPQFTNLVKKFGLCDKQSLMVMINVNSELEKWANVEQLLTAKSWVGSKKLNMSLPVDTLLADLQKSGAPESLLDNILNLIVDCDKRVEIARKLGRHMIVIDTLKKNDRAALLQYMALLDVQSTEYKYAEEILQTPVVM